MKISTTKSEKTDREKVLRWLKVINETDAKVIAEVIEQCSKDNEARAFYVSMYDKLDEDVKKQLTG